MNFQSPEKTAELEKKGGKKIYTKKSKICNLIVAKVLVHFNSMIILGHGYSFSWHEHRD